MKRLALTAVGAAVVGLAACSNGTASTAASASHGTASAAASAGHGTAPLAESASCRQQYQTWNQGPGKGFIATFQAVSVASTASDPQALTVALRNARLPVARAASSPVPACADPRGYWPVLLMHINAAVASKGSAAMRAAVQGVPEIERELAAEVRALT
jgi:hypothetical protein